MSQSESGTRAGWIAAVVGILALLVAAVALWRDWTNYPFGDERDGAATPAPTVTTAPQAPATGAVVRTSRPVGKPGVTRSTAPARDTDGGDGEPVVTVRRAYLADLKAVTPGGFKERTVTLDGDDLRHSLVRGVNNCTVEGTAAYAIGRDYARLAGRFGLGDESPRPESDVVLEIMGDGELLETVPLEVGRATPVNLDVRDVVRLEFRWEYVNPRLCVGVGADAILVLGDVEVVPGG